MNDTKKWENKTNAEKKLDLLIGSIQDTMEDYERHYEGMRVTKEVANEIVSVLDTILVANEAVSHLEELK